MARVEPVGCFGEARCVPTHGNADDSGLCLRCEDAAIEAREAHIAKLRAALTAFAEQMPGKMWDYAVEATISALVRSLSLDGRCRLCGCQNGCVPGCAAVALAELLD